MEKKVYIIIVNYNCGDHIIECLDSLQKIEYKNFNVIIVDNASQDDSIKNIKEKFSTVKIIQNTKNVGFAKAVNIGIKNIKETDDCYVLLLNPDVVVDKNFLNELIKVAEKDKKVGLVGPKIYYYKRKKIWSYGVKFSTGSVLKTKIYFAGPLLIGCGEIDQSQYDNIEKVDLLTGCCMLIKSEIIKKVGLLDEKFFLFHEDIDYSIRVKKAGYKICVAPKSIIWHKVSKSLIEDEEPTQESYISSPLCIYYTNKNWILLVKKHFTTTIYYKFLFAYLIRILPIKFLNLIKRKKLTIKTFIQYIRVIMLIIANL